jgi:hypothetical protein
VEKSLMASCTLSTITMLWASLRRLCCYLFISILYFNLRNTTATGVELSLASPNELKFVGKYSQVMSHLDSKFGPMKFGLVWFGHQVFCL